MTQVPRPPVSPPPAPLAEDVGAEIAGVPASQLGHMLPREHPSFALLNDLPEQYQRALLRDLFLAHGSEDWGVPLGVHLPSGPGLVNGLARGEPCPGEPARNMVTEVGQQHQLDTQSETEQRQSEHMHCGFDQWSVNGYIHVFAC